MIKHLQISGVHSQLTDDMRLYVEKKIGGLYKYLPKAARESAHVEVKLKEKKSKNKQTHECEVIMKLPGKTITAHQSSQSVLAAIDEVEANLKNQLKKYKDLHSPERLHRRVISRFRGKTA
jgi:ribosomal subunit interface protein